MSAGSTKISGALLLPESQADVPTDDGVALRGHAGAIEMAVKGGVWVPAFLRPAIKMPLLGDADATIDPNADKCSMYIMPPNTLTAPRTLTFVNAGQDDRHIVAIIRLDTSANDLVIKNSATTVLYSGTGGAARGKQFLIFMNAGVWGPNTLNWVGLT